MGNVKTTKGTIFFKVLVMSIPTPPDVCHGYISSQLAVQPFTTLVHSAPSASFIDFMLVFSGGLASQMDGHRVNISGRNNH